MEGKFYTDNDYSEMIQEMLNLEPFQIKDFLDYHFSKSFKQNHNWITGLNKNLFPLRKQIEKSKNKTKLGIIDMWAKAKLTEIVKDVYVKTNPDYFLEQRFMLETFKNKEAQKSNYYERLKTEIERKGSSICNVDNYNVKVYTPELALFFISENLRVFNLITKEEQQIDGHRFLKTYKDAFQDGVKYFESNFSFSMNTLYGENSKLLERTIHTNYYHLELHSFNFGWSYVKKTYPLIISKDEIVNYGYYSGIVSKVDELRELNQRLFIDFEKCDHETPKIIPPKDWDKIFKSIEVWHVFNKLVEVIVNSKPTNENWANYSVIFQTLIDKNLIHKTKHRFILDWCDKNQNTDFTKQTKLKSNTSNHSTSLIESYLISSKLIDKN